MSTNACYHEVKFKKQHFFPEPSSNRKLNKSFFLMFGSSGKMTQIDFYMTLVDSKDNSTKTKH